MKSWLKENKFIIVFLVLILGFAFYWYELRPAQIRKECINKSSRVVEEGKFNVDKFRAEKVGLPQHEVNEDFYHYCLRSKGLEK